MSDKYIYSTICADTAYAVYPPNEDGKGVAVPLRTILVKGGAGIMSKHMITPRGVVTRVSAEDYAVLDKDYVFNMHRGAGYITVSDVESNPEKVAADMTQRDESDPLVPEDFKPEVDEGGKEHKKAPTSGRTKKK